MKINDALTFHFDTAPEFECPHYAFHISDAEFAAICRHTPPFATPFGRPLNFVLRCNLVMLQCSITCGQSTGETMSLIREASP